MTNRTPRIDPDASVPIVYGRPRYLAPILIAAVVASVIAAYVGFLNYGRLSTASQDDVLGNRAVTQRLDNSERRREVDNAEHRDRNEEAHACILELLEELLDRTGSRIPIDFAVPDPCRQYTHAGVPTTATTTTTASATKRRQTTTTTARRPASSPRPSPTTTATTVRPWTTTTSSVVPTIP